MTTIQIVVLAIVQGLTEFLPISSSGHLVLLPKGDAVGVSARIEDEGEAYLRIVEKLEEAKVI